MLEIKKLYAADAELNKKDDMFYNIINIIRTEPIGTLEFRINKADDTVSVIKTEIIITIDISDIHNSDCQKLRAQLKGALLSKHNKVYIKLFAEYNKTEMIALPILSWGGEMDHLYEMKQRGYLYEIDYVFNTIYIDSYVDLNTLFKKNVSQIIRNEKEEDRDTLEKIQNTVNELNEHISELSGIKEFDFIPQKD